MRLIPNQGQWDQAARYKIPLVGGQIWLEQQGLLYHFRQGTPHVGHGHGYPADLDSVQQHAFRVDFVGSRPDATLRPELRDQTYHNYFMGSDPSRWAGGVPLYGMLTYEALYPSVDLRFYGLGDYLKYDFIVAPGGDPSEIRLRFEGIDPHLNRAGELVYDLGFRTLTEQAPLAYQPIGGEKRILRCEYQLIDGELTYHLPDGHDPAYPLVIDPTLEFSTFSGAFDDNWGFTATYDTAGHAYGGGIQVNASFSLGYPTTLGAFQTVYQGGYTDVTISKFSPDGFNLIYSTYLGGNDDDQPHSMIVNSQQELIVMGRTRSGDFPIPNSGFQPNPQGGWDIFVVRFSFDGTQLLGGTYLGGSGDDGVNGDAWNDPGSGYGTTKYNYGDDSRGEVIVDANDQVYVAAPTQSSNFPVSPGAFQPNSGGNQDGVVVCLSPDLSTRQWATYFGGNGDDAAHTVKLSESGEVFIAGGTTSANLPTSSGVVRPNLAGGVDGFIAKLSPNGQNLGACTYLGTPQYDQIYLLEFDRNDFVYVAGQTLGNWPVVAPPAGPVYSTPRGKLFINKLSNNLNSIEFSTRFGSPGTQYPNISPTAFLVDRCDNMYLAGWGGPLGGPNLGNTYGLPTTADAYQLSTSDGADMYLMSLSRDAQDLTYATFLGGNEAEHLDGGTCRFDKNGILYHAVCAGCWGRSSFPTTAGVHSQTNNASANNGTANTDGCNLAVFKMAFELDGLEADFTPLDENNQPLNALSGCPPLTVNFDNRSFQGASPGNVEYSWDFGYNGGTSNQYEPTFVYPNPGTYTARLVIVDSASCNIADTAYQEILVYPPPQVDAGPDQDVCPGDTTVLQSSSPAVSYQWSPTTYVLGDPNQATVEVSVPTTTRFILTIVNDNGCEARDTVILSTENAIELDPGQDTTVCQGGTANLRVSPLTPTQLTSYQWTSSPAVSIPNPDQSTITVDSLDTTTTFYIAVEDALGCRGFDSVVVEVFEVFTLQDTFVCEGESLVLATSNGVSFRWTPDDGSLSDPNLASPTATPAQTTRYTVEAISVDGCLSSKDVLVEVFDNPTAEAGDDVELCLGEQTQLEGSGGLVYQWSPGQSLSDSLVVDPFASPTTTTDYVLRVADQRGCQDTDTVQVVVHPLPEVRASEEATICELDSIGLQASGAIRYEWFPVSSLSDPGVADPVAFPRDTTTYIVIGTDANGCASRDSVTISVIPKPQTLIEGENLCDLRYIELRASGGETYRWNTGETEPILQVLPADSTTYIATAWVGSCEGYPDTITIDESFGYPEAQFEVLQENDFAPQTISFANQSTGAERYYWTFGFSPTPSYEENPSYGYPSAGEYEVQLISISAGGCPDTAYQVIRLENVTLFVPSAFSPNGDDSNDFFYVGQNGLATLNLTIYNRWGTVVHEANQLDFRWDGTQAGRPVQEGVYVYVIRAMSVNGKSITRHGTVTLVR